MWKYEQKSGKLFDKDNKHCTTGWAGQREGMNNPDMQNVKNTGPIPCGLYTISGPYDSAHTGPYTLSLTPDPGNEMFGRDSFKIHGASAVNSKLSSEGCIILARAWREKIWNSEDHEIKVVRSIDEDEAQGLLKLS